MLQEEFVCTCPLKPMRGRWKRRGKWGKDGPGICLYFLQKHFPISIALVNRIILLVCPTFSRNSPWPDSLWTEVVGKTWGQKLQQNVSERKRRNDLTFCGPSSVNSSCIFCHRWGSHICGSSSSPPLPLRWLTLLKKPDCSRCCVEETRWNPWDLRSRLGSRAFGRWARPVWTAQERRRTESVGCWAKSPRQKRIAWRLVAPAPSPGPPRALLPRPPSSSPASQWECPRWKSQDARRPPQWSCTEARRGWPGSCSCRPPAAPQKDPGEQSPQIWNLQWLRLAPGFWSRWQRHRWALGPVLRPAPEDVKNQDHEQKSINMVSRTCFTGLSPFLLPAPVTLLWASMLSGAWSPRSPSMSPASDHNSDIHTSRSSEHWKQEQWKQKQQKSETPPQKVPCCTRVHLLKHWSAVCHATWSRHTPPTYQSPNSLCHWSLPRTGS